MKKGSLFSLLFLLLSLIFVESVSAQSITLDSIANAFNNNTQLENYRLSGYDIEANVATDVDDVLRITIDDETVSYKLNGSILSYDHLTESNVISAYLLVDSLGFLHGYNYGEVLTNYFSFSDEIETLDVDSDGFELKKNNSYFTAKVDINSQIKLFDKNTFYFKPHEFDEIKDYIDNNTVGNKNSICYNLAYDVSVGKEFNYIYIGEKEHLSNNAYKSVLSAIEAMYGEKVVEYFMEKYPSLIENDSTQFDGFKVITDYDGDDIIKNMEDMDDAKIIFVELDKKYIQDELLRSEYNGETVNHGKKTINIDFSDNQVYKVSFVNGSADSDLKFFYNYVLNSLVESEDQVDNDTVYFNVVDSKVVIGDKNNSIFKAVYNGEELTIMATDNSGVKKTISALNPNSIGIEYESKDAPSSHYRYGLYDVEANITYGTSIKYEVLEGNNQTVNLSKDDVFTFRLNIDYNKFSTSGVVYIDGSIVDNKYYITKEGSTIITFNKEFTSKLSAGDHVLEVIVDDGKAISTFNVVDNVVNPNTADNIISYVMFAVLSIIGLIIVAKYRRISSK